MPVLVLSGNRSTTLRVGVCPRPVARPLRNPRPALPRHRSAASSRAVTTMVAREFEMGGLMALLPAQWSPRVAGSGPEG